MIQTVNKLSIASRIVISLTCGVIIFYSTWFFLGSKENFDVLKENLLASLFNRTLGFSLLGLPSLLLIATIELIQTRHP